MRRFPASTTRVSILLVTLLACERRAEEPPTEGVVAAELPFAEAPLAADSFRLVSTVGDTVRLTVSDIEAGTRLARYRRVAAGVDSTVAIIERHAKTPISSFQRTHVESGSVTGEVRYGRGFDGQARLRLTSPRGEQEDNLRTPPPVLDMAQIPLVLMALEFGTVDSFSFNYVAPFERRALAARLLVAEGSLSIQGENRPAYRVRLLVSGLEERHWFDALPPHRLLRIEEITRNVTWSTP